MRTLSFEGFGGLTLSAQSYGDTEAPPVLLLHNGGRTGQDWADVGEALATAGRHAIALDLRGHGRSDWAADGRYDHEIHSRDIRTVVQTLSERPVIIGSALGGAAALLALGAGSDHLARALILVDVAIDPPAHDVQSLLTQLRATATPTHDPKVLEGHDRDHVGQALRDAASRLSLPTLVVRGAESRFASSAAAENLTGLIANAERVDIAGAGHYVATDQLDSFNAAILEFLERRAPREPISYESGSDARTLRDALGCFATGVTVVTTMCPEGRYVGLTANSFTSVSLDPPLILFSLARSAGSLPIFETAGHFAINVMHIGQQPTSSRFASRIADRFAGIDWESWESGVPILTGSLASFECRTHSIIDGGDHRIFIGQVIRARFEPSRDPLLYFRGRYRRFHFE